MTEQSIIKKCQRAIDKFNEDYNAFIREYDGDRKILVDEDRDFYEMDDLKLEQDSDDHLWRLNMDGFLSEPIYDYYEDTGELFDNTGDDPEWGDTFKACLHQCKKDLKRGKRFMAMDSDRIDAIQNGEIEDEE